MEILKPRSPIIAALVIVLLIAIAFSIIVFYSGPGNGSGGNRVVLRGSGATFLQPQLEAWIEAFMKDHGDIVIEYSGIGSGAGQQQFFKGLTDFCGSDPPLSRSKWEEYRGEVLQLPVILGAVVVIYNVPEIPKDVYLNITGKVIALIYLGEIKYWDDPRIVEINPAVSDKLPHAEIVAVHRSDSSGTTQIFTTFLHKAAPHLWPEDLVGKVVDWPVDRVGKGVGSKGNAGVVAEVKNTKYSIGYVELSYAIKNDIPMAAIMNKEGYFVLPTEEGIQSAARKALEMGYIPSVPDGDFSRELEAIVYASGEDSYPITAFSHIFIWKNYDDRGRARALKAFLEWLNENDSKHVIEGYVAVPPEVKAIWKEAIKLIEG